MSSPVALLHPARPSTPDDRAIGAYAIWLPTSEHGGFRSSDITEVVARDSGGRVIARLG